MAELLELPLPIECAGRRFDAEEARLEFAENSQQLFAPNPAYKQRRAFAVNAVELKNILGQVDTEYVDFDSCSPSQSRCSHCCGKLREAVHPIKWKAKYGGLEVSEPVRVEELESENSRLKRMYADLAFENEAIKGLLKKLQRRLYAGTPLTA